MAPTKNEDMKAKFQLVIDTLNFVITHPDNPQNGKEFKDGI